VSKDILGEEEVQQIKRLIETLNQSGFDFLEVEIGGMKVTIGKSGAPLKSAPPLQSTPAAAVQQSKPVEKRVADGIVEITAPMIGRFYSQSEPGAAAYVKVGTEVKPDSTVGLIEAMKMFNAVHAGVTGVIAEICVQDASLVEYGQVLFRVKAK
jgi:acetyl-CoA carboxylase biotin carboxyl carrier protein